MSLFFKRLFLQRFIFTLLFKNSKTDYIPQHNREHTMKHILPIRFQPSAVSSIVALFFALSSPLSFAQEAEQEGRLETITVTAQKRAQNLQEVPVTVFNGLIIL
jgi:hypothetical protein